MSLHADIRSRLVEMLAEPRPDERVLEDALRLLAKYRHTLITNTLVRRYGTAVLNGPFAGMRFVPQGTHGSHASMLLGCYEAELHPFVMSIPGRRYEAILNIGCAEGYYAVGLKRLVPEVEVHAYDTDPKARRTVLEVARQNGVSVEVGGLFAGEDFERFRGRKVLAIVDVEGAEIELLDPQRFPALQDMDVLVELHPTRRGHAADHVPDRFRATHRIERIENRMTSPPLPEMFDNLSTLDGLLAVWEWRIGRTPWAILTSRQT